VHRRTAEITGLWEIHNDFKSSLRQQSQNLNSVRAELGKKLAAMKTLLTTPGRAGKWSAWLKEHKIARSTADRLVVKHERSLNPNPNCLTDSISEPTDEEIQKLFDKIAPKLRRVLRTPASTYRFLDLLSSSLVLNREETDEGFIVVKPGVRVSVEQPLPEEAQAEPAPVIAVVPAEGNVESASTSMAL